MRFLGINHSFKPCITMYWYASLCSVTSPLHSREISCKLHNLMIDSKIILQPMKSWNMYIKPQGNLDHVNMRKGVLRPFIALQELSQFNLSGYSQQGWLIVVILAVHVWSCIHQVWEKVTVHSRSQLLSLPGAKLALTQMGPSSIDSLGRWLEPQCDLWGL